MIVGVISDTHGRLDPAIKARFAGVDHVIHAGDVGEQAILEQLHALAPVTVVRGNSGDHPWGDALPDAATVVFDGVPVLVVHNRVMLETFAAPQLLEMTKVHCGIVICGHTHVAEIGTEDGILYLNPGSASLPRYETPRSVALLRIADGAYAAEIYTLGSDLLF